MGYYLPFMLGAASTELMLTLIKMFSHLDSSFNGDGGRQTRVFRAVAANVVLYK